MFENHDQIDAVQSTRAQCLYHTTAGSHLNFWRYFLCCTFHHHHFGVYYYFYINFTFHLFLFSNYLFKVNWLLARQRCDLIDKSMNFEEEFIKWADGQFSIKVPAKELAR